MKNYKQEGGSGDCAGYEEKLNFKIFERKLEDDSYII